MQYTIIVNYEIFVEGVLELKQRLTRLRLLQLT